MKMKLKMGALAVALALSGAANANSLGLTQTVSPLDVLASAPAGTLLAQLVETVTTPTFTGTLRTAVYDGPEAGTNLDFYYQFSNSANSANSVGRVTGYNFDSFTTNVFQTAQAFGVFLAGAIPADSADRDTTGVIGFNMLPQGADSHGKLMPGLTSDTFIIRTNATQYTSGWAGVIDGTAGSAIAFQPAVPEPSTNALILAGLGLMGFIARRRTRRDNKAA